ncbi:hypothetical protein chiPu_0008301 [Chiloscyllium punctatum]|uniref:Cadherin domain-containing protein n=1 Tax=Chiloscyllium punctatum TaxID=137246 RepID=A0A401SHI3_CHIPU|nr:hypothetical protein [Chiloscyllium punctatum]
MDKAHPYMVGRAKVIVELIDVNDNAPEIKVTSVSSTVAEDAQFGSVIAVINVTDLDSAQNGHVYCEVPMIIPFKLQLALRGNYKLIASAILHRETTPLYNIKISAWDGGTPPISTHKNILVPVSDINVQAPKFTQSSYIVYLMENNTPGAFRYTVTALDYDIHKNGDVVYSIAENHLPKGPGSVTINAKNGNIYSLLSFDYEQLKQFHIQVQARDGGFPQLSRTAIVNVIILDQNDNVPVIVSPLVWNNSALLEIRPQSVHPGDLFTKRIATDADSGQNARLSYQILKATHPSKFTLSPLSGELRATTYFRDQNITTENLIFLVKDNGQPSRSSTATISFTIASNVTVKSFERTSEVKYFDYFSDLNRSLIIILGSASFLFLVVIIFLIVLKFKQDSNITEDYSIPVSCNRQRNSNDISNPIRVGKKTSCYGGPGQSEYCAFNSGIVQERFSIFETCSSYFALQRSEYPEHQSNDLAQPIMFMLTGNSL